VEGFEKVEREGSRLDSCVKSQGQAWECELLLPYPQL
jgi:hypothetical protein